MENFNSGREVVSGTNWSSALVWKFIHDDIRSV